jgi:protein-S-isoprenylcysteine O-methyltransferase Ste14
MNSIIYLSFVFALSEILVGVVKRSKKKTVRIREDKGSLIILWVCITLGFTGGFFLSGRINLFWEGFGFVFIVTGLIIRWTAILQLGKSFTVDVAITDTGTLKTDGLYESIRHPSYSGLICIVTGFAFIMSSVYSFLVFVLPVFLAIFYRINVEEKLMAREFGNSYLEYRSRTKKIIPGIF